MDIFDVLTLIGGLCLFMFGMNLMGDALERTADHCSNLAICIIDANAHNMNIHESLKERKFSPDFKEKHEAYMAKYSIQ